MKLRIVAAIIKKDVRSLYPLVILVTLLFAGDVLLTRLELVAAWPTLQAPVLILAATLLTLAVFQLDPAVSQVDDWLCRPVPRAELLAAKLMLLFAVLRLSQSVATLAIEPIQGASLAETVQRALLPQGSDALSLVLPLVLLIALITRTLVQGIGVLLALFICVFGIPAPFVTAPGPLEPAIGTATSPLGLDWLTTLPGTLVAYALFAMACWLVYWRRQVRTARALLGVAAVAMVVLTLMPMWVLPWRLVYAAQTGLTPPQSKTPPDTGSIYLRNPGTCFAATFMRTLGEDSEFAEARRAAGVRTWTGEDLADTGPNSIAFLTSIEPRRLPPDWRANLLYVEAEYFAGSGKSPLYSLRPTSYDTGSGSLSHAWVLPGFAVRRLGGEPHVELKLRYYLALLEPHPFSLPADGRRHAVPGLGYCSAQRKSTGYVIEVNCFSGFDHPAQVSAELADIPASRVDAVPNYSPRWARWPFGQNVKLSIGAPWLSPSDHITVTAWTLAAYVDESIESPGLLGGDSGSCPLPSSGGKQFVRSVWHDTAKHTASSITVDPGVQLEVLDFGGQGSPILLLAGLGATAHSYDELAPMLAQKHRVVAITRRGTGYSSRPDWGYDTPRLAQDVLQVMDALKLEKPLLIGHSIAGDELTWLGGHHPERFRGLVYLDAAYDRSGHALMNSRQKLLNQSLPPEPPIPPAALLDYEATSKLMAERGHVRLPEGELIAMWNFDRPFLAGKPGIDARIQQAIVAALKAPDYAAIRVPALAIYALPDPKKPLPPWYDAGDADLMATLAELGRINADAQRRNIELFRRGVSQGNALEMPNATHWLIQSNQPQVLDAIETFSLQLKER